MNNFLKNWFVSTKNLKKEKLPGDGGHRNYTRITADGKSLILMECGKNDPSLSHFINIQKRISPFVSVPKIFHQDLTSGRLLLEDLGDQSLEKLFFNRKKPTLSFYFQALRQMIRLQEKVSLSPADSLFDKAFFQKENEIAIFHLENYICQASKKKPFLFNKNSSKEFRKDMDRALSCFKRKDYVYCHRDFHSRNIMIKNRQTVIIDFQDAGAGPWHYDLTSLLYDSYVPLSALEKTELETFYFSTLGPALKRKTVSLSNVEFAVKLQFLQRGFKACGCFAAFKNRDGKNSHLKYIRPTLKVLRASAGELSYKGIHQYMDRLLETLPS